VAITQELVRFGQDSGDPFIWCVGLTGLGRVQERKGEFEESIANLNRAIELAEAVPSHLFRIQAGGHLASCYGCLGDLDKSLEILTETENYIVKNGAKAWRSSQLSIYPPQVYLMAAERSVGKTKEEWLRKAKQDCKKALRATKLYRSMLPSAMKFQGTYEWLRGKPSISEQWWQRSLKAAEEMGMPYESAMAHLEMGQWLKDRAHLEKAEAIFADIGAEWDLGQTRKLLKLYDALPNSISRMVQPA
jgi:tetratricopeptide (TPR) repeat protein